MAFEIFGGLDAPFHASTNVSTVTYSGTPPVYASGGIPQYSAVMIDTGTAIESDVILTTGASVVCLGITQDGPAVGPGQAVRVRQSGYTKALAGGAITVGQLVSANSSGQLVAAAAPGATNTYVVGIAQSAATQASDLFTVFLTPGATTQVNA